MTTNVIVKTANYPALVKFTRPGKPKQYISDDIRVDSFSEREFVIHDSQDIIVSELKKDQ